MGQGERVYCRKCYAKLKRLRVGKVCPKCGWSYAKEFGGQKELGGTNGSK